jgi:hypothetical protein
MVMQPQGTQSPQPDPPTAERVPTVKPRRRHLLLKLLITLGVAIAIVIAAVYWVLGTDYPRQIAVNVAQNITGLRVEIGKLSINPIGQTEIDDLRVALPLSDKPFLVAPRIQATHTSLLGMLVSFNVAIDGVTIPNPELDLRQNADGTWNLQQALAQLATPSKNAAGGGATTLPNVVLRDAIVHVTKADGKTLDLKNVTLTGTRTGPLVWTFDGKLVDGLTLAGEVSTAGRWPHRVDLGLSPNAVRTFDPLVGPIPVAASATLQWQGQKTATGIEGRLTIPEKSTQLGPILTRGTVKITVDGATVLAEPENLSVTPPGLPAVTLAGGQATLAGSQLSLAGVKVRFADGTARVNGSADIAKLRGNLTASWEQISFPAGVTHQGTFTLEAANIWPSRPWVKGSLNIKADAGGGTLQTAASISGTGPSWTDATYVIDLPRLSYARRSMLVFENLQATLHNTADTVELSDVRVRQTIAGTARLNANGVYHFAGDQAGEGYFTAVGNDFEFGGERNLAFNVNAWADRKSVTVQNVHANLGTDGWVNLAGQYTFSDPEPIAAQLDLDTSPDLSLMLSNKLAVAGHVSGTMKVGGTLSPTHVTVAGQVSSRKLKVDRYLIGDADLLVRGSLLPDRADVRTEKLDAFGGRGWFGAEFPYFSDEFHAWMGFEEINLADLGAAVGSDRLSGTAGGEIDLHVPVGEIDRTYGQGTLTVSKPSAKPLLTAESATVPIRIGDGYVRLMPSATQSAGGTAAVDALLSLNQPSKFKLKVDLKDWLTQLPAEEFSVLTSGKIDLPQVEIAAGAATGHVRVDNRFFAHDKPIGDVGLRASAEGRLMRLDGLNGNVLGGRVRGKGSIQLDELSQGRLDASVDGLSLDRLAQIDPRLTGVQGQLSATLSAHAAQVPRPLGPLQADIVVDSDRASYKGIDIGDMQVRFFADRDRVAMADDPNNPNRVQLAGGELLLWGRLGQVPAGDDGVSRTSAFLSVHMNQLDTEQLNRMIDPDGKPVPGRLDGDIVAFGNAADVKRMSGQGHLKLSKSDLGNISVFAVLYNAMHLGLVPSAPNGYGDVNFRLTDGRLEIVGLNYFNRGVYAKGNLTLDNVLDLKYSPVSGYVLGTFRPLKDLKLPFFGTIDSILDALQSSATTLRIDGSMKKIQATPVSLRKVSKGLRDILVGEAQAK